MATSSDEGAAGKGEPRAPAPARAYATLAVLFLVALFNNVDRALISILQVPIKQDLSLSDSQMGALTGLTFAIVYGLVSLPMGQMVDRYRRTWLLAAALTVWTLLTATSGLARSFAMLIVCRLGVAFGEACGNPASYSLLADCYPPQRRGTVFALFTVAPFLGIFFGIFAGGWLSHDLGWRQSFIVIGLSGLLIVPLLIFLPEPVRGQSDALHADPGPALTLWQTLAQLASNRTFRFLVAAMTFQNFVTAAFLNWTAPFLSRVHGLPLIEVSLWAAIPIGVGGAAGALSSGLAVDALTRRNPGWYGWSSALASMLILFVALAEFLVADVRLSIVISFVTAFLTAFYLAPSYAAANAIVPSSMRGLTTAVLTMVPVILGSGLGPFMVGVTSDYLSITQSFGKEGLRYALILMMTPSLLAALCYAKMGWSLAAEQPAP